MMQQPPHKNLALLTRRQLLCQKVSLIVMIVDIARSPLLTISNLPNHMIGDTLTLLLQIRFRDTIIFQD